MSNPNQSNKPDLNEPELISIIEGPPPQFQFEDDQSTLIFQDTTGPYEIARCDTRTFSGPKMLARCTNAWAERRAVMLEYKDLDGLKQRAEIAGIRYDTLDEGTLLQIWVRFPIEMQLIQIEDDEDDEDGDDENEDEDENTES